MFPPCRFDNYCAKTGKQFVKKGIWQIIHFTFTGAIHREPDCWFRPLPPFLQWNHEFDSTLFSRQLKAGEERRGAVADGADVENATFPVRC